MNELLQYVVTGLADGMIYALLALGFVLIWKSSGVANLAIGQIVLLCSWFAYAMLVQLSFPLWLGLICVIAFALLLGWFIERFALRPLIAQPILSLIAVTLGLGYLFEGLITMIWPQSFAVLPEIFPSDTLHIGTAVVSTENLWVAGVCLMVFLLLSLYFRFHKMGIAMRATADDQKAVQACGIPVTSIFANSWMIACLVGAVGGVLLASMYGVKFGLVETSLKALSVVILGGMDSFLGALIAGPIIGLAENIGGGYLTPYLWPLFKDIVPYLIIIIVIIFKPYGLFGAKRIERI